MTVIETALLMMRNRRHPETIAAYLAREIDQCKTAADEFVSAFIAAQQHAREHKEQS